jgi:MSHA biogenesis protein MshJ
MKQHLQRIALKIDALSLRERSIVFAMAALILMVLVNTALLEPRFAKQKQLSQRIKQDQSVMAKLQAQIQERMAANEADPDKADKLRLQETKDQTEQMLGALHDMEKAMVSPDKMSALLEDILKRNHALRLVSLKTLAASPLAEQMQAEEKSIDSVLPPNKGIAQNTVKGRLDGAVALPVYKHGVEIVVQGGYLDLMNYLAQLEAMPWQLLWAKAKLETNDYPRSTLTLTLYTLSLDKKWLNL